MGWTVSSALFSRLHMLGWAGMATGLALELRRLRPGLSASDLHSLVKTDGLLGGAAVVMLLTGLARVFWFAKGPLFYAYSPVFWLKMGVFSAVVLLSIYPTVCFTRWSRAARGGGVPAAFAETLPLVRRLLWLEAAGLLLIPLLAALMARGVGMG